MARPVALVFGFAFMFYIMNIAFWFAAMGLGIFLSGMLSDVIMGPGAFVGTLAIIMSTIFMIVRYTLKMITHLPDNLPRWIGGASNNVGDVQAAEGANQSAQNSTAQAALNGFALGQQSFTRSEGATQREVSQIEARGEKALAKREAASIAAKDAETQERRHSEMMDAMTHMGSGSKSDSSGGGMDLKDL